LDDTIYYDDYDNVKKDIHPLTSSGMKNANKICQDEGFKDFFHFVREMKSHDKQLPICKKKMGSLIPKTYMTVEKREPTITKIYEVSEVLSEKSKLDLKEEMDEKDDIDITTEFGTYNDQSLIDKLKSLHNKLEKTKRVCINQEERDNLKENLKQEVKDLLAYSKVHAKYENWLGAYEVDYKENHYTLAELDEDYCEMQIKRVQPKYYGIAPKYGEVFDGYNKIENLKSKK